MNHRFHYRPPSAGNQYMRSRLMRYRVSLSNVADRVDLRPLMLTVRDQGAEGCCSGFATAALREGLRSVALGTTLQTNYFSPAYLYARTRMAEGTFPQDAGATVADEMATLENFGVCAESLLPYSGDATLGVTPETDVAAAGARIASPICLGMSACVQISDVEDALAARRSVVFGMPVRMSFNSTGSDGLVPLPRDDELLLGGHAMLAVGYDRPARRFIVRNSWGKGWGLGGYCLLPYSLVPTWFEAWSAEIGA